MNEIAKNGQKQNIRLLAVKALSDINRKGAYANIVLQDYISKYNLLIVFLKSLVFLIS